MKPHVHAELIKAWADGAEIQVSVDGHSAWHSYQNNENPSWKPEYHYRIKPEPKSDLIAYETHICWDKGWQWVNTTSTKPPNLKLTFDYKTGELKSAEVLK